MNTDVAIVGAGPAGAVAAQRLAAAGVQVLVVEQATFPRDKPCGDGVGSKGLAVLDRCGLGEWASQFPTPQILRIRSPDGQVLDIQPPPSNGNCYGRTIPRRLLDARLAQQAVDAGARLVEDTRVRRVEWDEGTKPTIVANGSRITAQLIILADGSQAPITRRLGLVQEWPELVAMRQYFAGDAGPAERLEIHFQPEVMPGYTWLFPMGDGRVNIGTGTFVRWTRRGKISLRDMLARFVQTLQTTDGRLAQAKAAGPAQGHPLRTHLGGTRSHAERVLVAGDAAGLVSPLTGEGIATALESGELAASHALAALEAGDLSAQALAAYSQELYTRYRDDQRAARFLRLGISVPCVLNRIVRRLQQDQELAVSIGHIIIGYKSPRLALRPSTWARLLIR